jgi:hypothetical protein
MSVDPVLRIGGVSIIRDDVALIDDVTWEVRTGER